MAKNKKGDYEVGYGRPPVEHRFSKGTSGNPAGRPTRKRQPKFESGASFVWGRYIKLLTQKVFITEGGKRKKVAIMDVLITKQIQNALKGDAAGLTALLKTTAEAARALPSAVDSGPLEIIIHGGLPDDDHYVSEEEIRFHMWQDLEARKQAGNADEALALTLAEAKGANNSQT